MKVIRTVDDLIHNMPATNTISLDTETTSLSYYDLEIVGFSIGYINSDNEVDGFYVDLFRNGDFNEILNTLSSSLGNYKTIIMHNASYDMRVLHKYGIQVGEVGEVGVVGVVWDTMTAAHLLDENGPKGLKDLAHKILHIPLWEIKGYEEVEENTAEFYQYAINDALWTYGLYEAFKPRLEQEGLIDLFLNTEMPFQHVLKDMGINGMGVDLEKRNETYYALRHIIYTLEHDLLDMCNGFYNIKLNRKGEHECIPSINFGSSPQLISIAENIFNLEITERTPKSKKHPKGQKSFAKATLTRLKGHPFIDLLTKYRSANKLMNTFVDNMGDFVDEDQRIRASFNNCVAVTGRLSCSNPNLEQLPRNNEICNIRDIFVAKSGCELIVADYGGQELVVLAEETQDEILWDTILNDKDIHLMVANSVFNLNLDSKCFRKNTEYNDKAVSENKEKRHSAKNGIVFPVVYGSTAYGIAQYFNIPEEEAQGYLDAFLNLYPGIRRSMEKCKQELDRQEYVVDMFGRRRRFPGYRNMWKGYKERCERQAFNFKIQSPSATMCRGAANRIRNMGYNIVNMVHDEIIVEVEEDFVLIGMKDIEEAMVNNTGLSIPIGVSIDHAKSYGAAK